MAITKRKGNEAHSEAIISRKYLMTHSPLSRMPYLQQITFANRPVKPPNHRIQLFSEALLLAFRPEQHIKYLEPLFLFSGKIILHSEQAMKSWNAALEGEIIRSMPLLFENCNTMDQTPQMELSRYCTLAPIYCWKLFTCSVRSHWPMWCWLISV